MRAIVTLAMRPSIRVDRGTGADTTAAPRDPNVGVRTASFCDSVPMGRRRGIAAKRLAV
eukprot:CAMPEP_0194500964 /NCGR_PEP_ID=MMETSP0253-20130528/20460_1 /TAXON_ID=2966 /ORGANISM="Noctiluca scintillans" /LENGTH=58 /DNA_ID=CAMNT_0039342859 /DNA_START=37 /DNA_END=209 /DNA_ORIENTATION=-